MKFMRRIQMTKAKVTTKVVQADFKDKEMFCIKSFTGIEADKYPVHNFGIKKAKILMEHIEELKLFIKENE